MSTTTGTQSPFSSFSSPSQPTYNQSSKATGWYGIDTSSYKSLPSYTTEYIFHIMNSMFKLSLEPKQIQLLQDLYNSNDEANRTMATSMFHALLFKKEEDK
jgi:hypothetical protein